MRDSSFLITLIGLIAKNGILIVEIANQLQIHAESTQLVWDDAQIILSLALLLSEF